MSLNGPLPAERPAGLDRRVERPPISRIIDEVRIKTSEARLQRCESNLVEYTADEEHGRGYVD
jgi:hypothetical protein